MLSFALMLAADWSLHYERSGYLETGRYEEAVSYCRRLAAASPYARVIEYGTSPQGRKMVALVVSRDGKFSEKDLAKSAKPLIFVQNGIHSGEIEGKDASLMLAREMLVTGKEKSLLEGANWVIVPIFSVDAHERFSPYNRINQNGPREMGWRSTAQNINLNRDWVKADTPEMQAQVKLVQRFRPDFFFDNHTTDGSDHPYVLTLSVPNGPGLPPAVASWQTRLFEAVKPRTERDGFLTSPYLSLADRSDPKRGLSVDDYSPRYSHGYLGTLNRPAMLVETHVLKPYKQRVESTYSVMKHTVELCIRDAAGLKAMNRANDAAEAAGNPHPVLSSRRSNKGRPFTFLSHPYTPYRSEVTGGMIAKWDRSTIVPVETTLYDQFEPGFTADAPAGYAIPLEWSEAISKLSLHGLKVERTKKPVTAEFESYRFEEVSFPTSPFEGRFMPRFRAVRITEQRTLPAGSAFVSTKQVGSKLLMHLLEPDGPDSLAKWGLFNNVFEQKEYFEDYAAEPMAVKLLAENPKVRAEYEERLKDEKFAKDPSARLRFLFERSPFFDVRLNKYPVVRLSESQLKQLR